MAQGPYAALYQSVEMELVARHERVLLDILRGIAWHADPLGLCWPGYARLEYVTRRAKETIPGYIQQLLDKDFVRVHERVDPVRRQMQRTYQVSPYVMYVREELEEEAIALWATGKNVIEEMDFVTKPPQPDIEPDTEPESNQNQLTKTRTTTTTRTRTTSASNEAGGERPTGQAAADGTGGKTKSKKQTAPQPEQPQSGDQTNQPQRGGNPASTGRGRQSADMTQFRAALPDVADELLAQRLARNLATRETQARQLVAEYGREVVQVAERWLSEESAKGSAVGKPFGLLRWWLKTNCISPDDTPTDFPDQAAAGVTGKYADFFKR